MVHKNNDTYLLNSLKVGDEEGIDMIYSILYPKIKKYIISRDGSEDDAKDVMQKGLLQVSARVQAADFEITSTFGGYFMTVCKNIWIRETKISKLRVTNDRIIDHIHEEKELALAVYEQEKWELFQEKLMVISENCRQILNFVFNMIPYADIADKLEYATENTVRQRVFKCKAKLKEAIHSDERYKELKEL